jgi:hypothetical protein
MLGSGAFAFMAPRIKFSLYIKTSQKKSQPFNEIELLYIIFQMNSNPDQLLHPLPLSIHSQVHSKTWAALPTWKTKVQNHLQSLKHFWAHLEYHSKPHLQCNNLNCTVTGGELHAACCTRHEHTCFLQRSNDWRKLPSLLVSPSMELLAQHYQRWIYVQ